MTFIDFCKTDVQPQMHHKFCYFKIAMLEPWWHFLTFNELSTYDLILINKNRNYRIRVRVTHIPIISSLLRAYLSIFFWSYEKWTCWLVIFCFWYLFSTLWLLMSESIFSLVRQQLDQSIVNFISFKHCFFFHGWLSTNFKFAECFCKHFQPYL